MGVKISDSVKKELFVKTSPNTIVEVFRFKGNEVISKKMTFEEFLNLERLTGFRYLAFEVGFCSIKTNQNENK